MSKERVKFYPHPASQKDDFLYEHLLDRLYESDEFQREFRQAKNDKKKRLKLIHKLLWNFFSTNQDKFEPWIKGYFNIDKKIGHTLLWKTFMPGSYEKSEPQNVGFVIEVADLICKYVEEDFSMTFFQWTKSETPADLEKYLTAFNKNEKIDDLDKLYKLKGKEKEGAKKAKKKKKRKKRKYDIKEQFNLIGQNARVIKEQNNTFNINPS